jgi:hypothetical protein
MASGCNIRMAYIKDNKLTGNTKHKISQIHSRAPNAIDFEYQAVDPTTRKAGNNCPTRESLLKTGKFNR